MPVPLVWLGAGLAAGVMSSQIRKHHDISTQRVKYYPGETRQIAFPVDGALVCCGIYGAFEHTGIWADGDIIELKGNGLIRAISPERFLDNRSGDDIYVLCDSQGQALVMPDTIQRAVEKLYQYSEYHVLRNNCHRFCWHCISGENRTISTFNDLNLALYQLFSQPLAWYKVAQ